MSVIVDARKTYELFNPLMCYFWLAKLVFQKRLWRLYKALLAVPTTWFYKLRRSCCCLGTHIVTVTMHCCQWCCCRGVDDVPIVHGMGLVGNTDPIAHQKLLLVPVVRPDHVVPYLERACHRGEALGRCMPHDFLCGFAVLIIEIDRSRARKGK